ncbi:hypothetical protein [Cohnella herbarum]|uniref:Uncharacterized protein n=1 Tax=Cohnella herbarum TaxID=2728023 RepID=A0A7Z2VLS2_9BACL|nr:hypothetical protein [Cohnella herbarum]QJD85274.1 hypothetical protein HH215_20245 [Cohnella herbarum]
MFKKISAVFIAFALLLQLLPAQAPLANAAVGNGSFVFPSESSNPSSYRITTDARVTLQGSINNVNPTTISYSVHQIIDDKNDSDPTNDIIGTSKLDQTSNIYPDGNAITIFNIELFPGKNKITFKGLQNGGEVADSFYIDYRNGPLFYNLMAQIDGQAFPVTDGKTTVVYSNASKGRNNYDISITGNAPNAQNVTIVVNGNSKTYNVNPSNNNSFVASPVNLKKGKNLVTIRVKNNSQTLETTREIAFYNGSVTYYDVNINEGAGTDGMPMEYYPNYNFSNINNVQVSGKVIVPNSEYADVVSGPLEPHPDPTWPVGGADNSGTKKVRVIYGPSVTDYVYATPEPLTNKKDKFFVYSFALSNAQLKTAVGGTLDQDTRYNVQLLSDNEVNKHLNITPSQEGTNELGFILQNGNDPYIHEMNYLQSYNGTNYENITGGPLHGTNIFSMPFAVEFLIGNPPAAGYGLTDLPMKIDSIKDIAGQTQTTPPVFRRVNTNAADVKTVTKMVNGVTKTFYRIVYEFSSMPVTGTQTINFQMQTGSQVLKPATINLLYGPYANYDKAVDGMIISVDTTQTETQQATEIITNKLGNFAGTFKNIANETKIKYVSPGQTVFFYINNTLVPLKKGVRLDGNNVDKATIADFQLDIAADPDPAQPAPPNSLRDIYNKFYSGENKIRILYQTATESYDKTIKINLVPTNLPVIPAPGTSGIFPYGTQYNDIPLSNDPNFPMRGSIFTTSLSEMNVFGTFDFLDLGTTETAVINKMLSIATTTQQKYILKVTTPSEKDPWKWDLSQPFQLVKDGKVVGSYPASSPFTSDLTVQYNMDLQSFSFTIKRQKLNIDGSSKIYNFFVYNSGEAGPRATYRLEVDPTSIPYKILRPILPAKNTVNQNFIEVVIDALALIKC